MPIMRTSDLAVHFKGQNHIQAIETTKTLQLLGLNLEVHHSMEWKELNYIVRQRHPKKEHWVPLIRVYAGGQIEYMYDGFTF